jgi:hypothetical protein
LCLQVRIQFRAISNACFAALTPNDAHYRVAAYQVTFLRNGKAMEPSLSITGREFSLSELKTKIQAGDQLQIDVKLVQRLNFQDQIESIPLEKQFIIPIPAALE